MAGSAAAETSEGDALDEALKVWFSALAAEPVPEALLKHVEALDAGPEATPEA
jgi:hypothetical protein